MSSSRDHAQTVGAALDKVWVVLGSSGQWSDWSQWAVCVCEDEQTAKDKVGALTSAVRVHMSIEPQYDVESGEDFVEWCNRTAAEREAWGAALAAIDPHADEYDEPRYQPVEVPFFSSAKPTASESSRDEQKGLNNDL